MAKQPKIRFKGFTEEWKDQRLGDIGKAISGIGFPEDCQGGRQGVPFYKVSDFSNVGNEFVMRNANNYVSEEQIKRYGWKPITQLPAILFAKVGAAVFLNRKRFVLSPTLCDNNTMLFTLKPNACETFFAKYLFDNIYLPSLVQIGTLPSYNGSQVEDIVVYLPKPDEQKRISGCLNELTKVISQREAELEKFKNIKRALLEKLFPQDGQSIPAIRFKGFESKWSDVPFGKLIIENKEVSTVENEDTLLSSAIEGMFLNSELFDHQRGQSNIGYRKITKGMLILSAQNLHLGNANVNLRFDHGIVSPAYKTYNIQGADTEFMAVWVKREETKAFFDKATTAGASKCRKNIDWDDLYQQNLAMPLDDEQKKIGKFILTLDRLITLREKYIKQLKH